jgi:suppressor for copper-sensitivity B
MRRPLPLLLLLLVLLLPVAPQAADWGAIGLGPTADGGLAARIDLRPGWKIVAAIEQVATPPASAEIAGRALHLAWPAPARFAAFGLQGIGWEGAVPLGIGGAGGRDGRLLLRVVVCKTVCIPVEAAWEIVAGRPVSTASPEAHLLARAEAPIVPAPANGLRLLARPDGLLLAGDAADAALRGAGDAGLRPPERLPEGLLFRGAVAAGPVFVWTWGPERAGALAPPVQGGVPWLPLGLAFLGGILLTAMPCVLPLLFVKAAALGRGGGSRVALLAAAGGIVAAFAAVGVALGAAAALGRPVGWSSLFQEPATLAALAGIVLFGALWMGPLPPPAPPAWAGCLAARLPGGRWGDAGGGALLAVLALPCTAPFLGTAAGLAFAGPPWHVPLIFLAAGAGLALPWALVGLLPPLARLLPRPGRWMAWAKTLAGISLAILAAWLLSVLAAAAGWTAAIAAGGILALGALAAIRHPDAGLAPLPAAALAAALLAAPPPPPAPPPGWDRFAVETMARAEAAGDVILVEVTAAWCITCRVNRAVALQGLDLSGVRALQADMTGPNPEARALLARHGRAGLPFVLVLGPGIPEGRVLPELLTPSAVRDALAEAAAAPAEAGERF